MSSRDVNLAKVNPLKLNRALSDLIGPVDNVWLLNDRVKVRCTNAQANILKHEKRIYQYSLNCEIKEIKKIIRNNKLYSYSHYIEKQTLKRT